MSVRILPRFILGLLIAGVVMPLAANEPFFTKDLKVRTGYAPSTKDELNNAIQGFGLNLGFELELGKLGVELGYFNKSGSQFQKPISTTVPAGLSPVEAPEHIGDSRRNSLDGFSVRLSFQRALNEDWKWQAGLMVGGTRFKHEYVGDVSSVDWNSDNEASWRDFYQGTPVEGGMGVSPFAGVTYRLSDRSSLEINALLLTYKALDYVHAPGTGNYHFPTEHPEWMAPGRLCVNDFSQDRLEKKTRMMPHLEFAYVFHF